MLTQSPLRLVWEIRERIYFPQWPKRKTPHEGSQTHAAPYHLQPPHIWITLPPTSINIACHFYNITPAYPRLMLWIIQRPALLEKPFHAQAFRDTQRPPLCPSIQPRLHFPRPLRRSSLPVHQMPSDFSPSIPDPATPISPPAPNSLISHSLYIYTGPDPLFLYQFVIVAMCLMPSLSSLCSL